MKNSSSNISLLDINREGEAFSEQILADLIAQGVSGDDLTEAFREAKAQIRPAVEAMLEEAERAAAQPEKHASYADVFDN